MREEFLVTLLNEYGDEIVLLLPSRQDLAYIPRKYSIEEVIPVIISKINTELKCNFHFIC